MKGALSSYLTVPLSLHDDFDSPMRSLVGTCLRAFYTHYNSNFQVHSSFNQIDYKPKIARFLSGQHLSLL